MARDKPPIPSAFFLVAGANFLFFLNFAFFFLLPIWVLGHGGGEEVAGRVTGAAGLAGLVALPFIGWLLDRSGSIDTWEAAHPARVDTRPIGSA